MTDSGKPSLAEIMAGKMEPQADQIGLGHGYAPLSDVAAVSQAISAKRQADALETIATILGACCSFGMFDVRTTQG